MLAHATMQLIKASYLIVPSFHYCRLFTSDGKTRVGSLYNKDSKKYNRMSLQGNIVSIEQLQNFRASKMNFWNNVVPNTNFTCNASSAAPRRVFHMSSFLLTPCELVLFFYVNKYLQASNNEQLLYTRGNSVATRQRRVIIKERKKSLELFFFYQRLVR